MEVGVRELKARLSEYLRRAEQGEIVIVTERNRPKAILAPLPGRVRLEEGIAQGWIRPPVTIDALRNVHRHQSTRRTLDVLAEDRA